MLSFTLDTNCLIALENNELSASAIRTLADAHATGVAHVAVVAISASERQRGGRLISNFAEFRQSLADLGLDHLEILPPLAYFDISFWDWCLWSDDEMQAFERRIHEVLFPQIDFNWGDYCRTCGLDPQSPPAGKWRNCKCDVQAIWTHIHTGRDVFVTADQNFHAPSKKPRLVALGANSIEYPANAAALLQR